MAETLLNKNQAGAGIWTEDSLKAGKNTEIVQKVNPYVISDKTYCVLNFASSSPASGTSLTVSGTGGHGGNTEGLTLSDSTATKLEGADISFGIYDSHYSISIGDQSITHWDRPVLVANPDLASGNYYININKQAGYYGVITAQVQTIDFWYRSRGDSYRGEWINMYFASSEGYWTDAVARFENNSGGLKVVLRQNSTVKATHNYSSSEVPFFDQAWHHVAATYNLATKKVSVYVDGTCLFTEDLDVGMEAMVIGGGSGNITACPIRFNDICAFDEIRISLYDCYEGANYTVPTEPYSESASSSYFVINNTLDISDLLTTITGYDASKQQTLQNDNGTLKWVDNA